MTQTLIGCDSLREWLIAEGFCVAFDSLSRSDGCNWYAYRKTALEARECECNQGKTMQLVVKPYRMERPGYEAWESVQVDVTGEAGGIWFKLQAYSLPHDLFRQRLPEIELALVAAWNALRD